MISDEEHQKRLDLYNQGLNDNEIAEKNEVSKQAIYQWRKRNNLEPNKQISKKEHNKRLKLYNKGLSDKKIAKRVGVSRTTIRYWRNQNSLEPNFSVSNTKISSHNKEKVLKLYRQGLTDNEIADEIGVSDGTILNWRNKNQLEPNGHLSQNEHQKRLELYEKGLVDEEIADELGVTSQTIWEWRDKYNLKPNDTTNQEISEEIKSEIEDWYFEGYNDYEIADKVGVSRSVICNYRYRNDLPAHNPFKSHNKLSDYEHQKRLDLYNQGLNDNEIADKVGLTRNGIVSWRRRNNLPSNYKKGD